MAKLELLGALHITLFTLVHLIYGANIEQIIDVKLYRVLSERLEVLEKGLRQQTAEIDEMKNEHRKEIIMLQRENREELEYMKKGHAIELSTLKEEIANLRLEHDKRIQELKDQIAMHEKDVDEIRRVTLETVGVSNSETFGENTDHAVTLHSPNANNSHFFENKNSSTEHIEDTKQVDVRKRQESSDHVAFFAKLGASSLSLGKNQVIKFEIVTTNIGNAYDSHVGVFRAPIAGAYLFSTTITSHSTNSGHVGFYINENKETEFFNNGGQNAWDETSQTIIVHLNVGDDVTVRCLDMGHGIAGWSHSVLSGVLLFENFGHSSIVGK